MTDTQTIDELIAEHRDKFSAIPNLIYEMGLSAYEISLYSAIKRSAGDSGECTRTADTLAGNAGMSHGKVSDVKQALLERGLISIRQVQSRRGRNRHIIAVNPLIWIANDIYFLLPPEERPAGKLVLSQDEQIAISSPRDLIRSQDDLIRSPRDLRKNLYRKNLHRKEAVSPDDFSDLDWHTGNDKPPDNGSVEAFTTSGDPVHDMLLASDLKKRRAVPEWAIGGAEGAHPLFPVLRAFCDLTRQDVKRLTDNEGKDWLGVFAKMARSKEVGVAQLVEAHRILPEEGWGDWHLSHHKWSSPRVQSYADMVVLAARQLRDGELDSTNVIRM